MILNKESSFQDRDSSKFCIIINMERQILKSCESISLWAKKLQILKQCSDAIAPNACIDPELFTLSKDDALEYSSKWCWKLETPRCSGELVDWRRFMPLNRSFLLRLLKLTTETLIRVHPEEENSVSGNMLLHLLKLGIIMRIKSELPNKLEKRLALKLEN